MVPEQPIATSNLASRISAGQQGEEGSHVPSALVDRLLRHDPMGEEAIGEADMAEFERTGQFRVRTLTERKFRRATSDVDHKMSLVGRWYGAECAEMDEAGLLSAGDNAYGDSCLGEAASMKSR